MPKRTRPRPSSTHGCVCRAFRTGPLLIAPSRPPAIPTARWHRPAGGGLEAAIIPAHVRVEDVPDPAERTRPNEAVAASHRRRSHAARWSGRIQTLQLASRILDAEAPTDGRPRVVAGPLPGDESAAHGDGVGEPLVERLAAEQRDLRLGHV